VNNDNDILYIRNTPHRETHPFETCGSNIYNIIRLRRPPRLGTISKRPESIYAYIYIYTFSIYAAQCHTNIICDTVTHIDTHTSHAHPHITRHIIYTQNPVQRGVYRDEITILYKYIRSDVETRYP
jgi:hypothetical protein